MKKIILLLLLLIFLLLKLPAVEKEIILGEENWQPLKIENIEFEKENKGSTFLVLKDGEYVPTDSTKLLLHFNDSSVRDEAGNFYIQQNLSKNSQTIKKLGSGAAVFDGKKDPIILTQKAESYLPEEIYSEDFSIDFWISGHTFSSGETIFLFENYVSKKNIFLPQFLKCYLEERKIIWYFKNFFLTPELNEFEFQLQGKKGLIPDVWSHHLLRYDSSLGLMEYLVNGIPEDVIYVNPSGKETGDTLPVYWSKQGKIIIGDRFTGLIDELRVDFSFLSDVNLAKYKNYYGTYISMPIDLEHSKSSVITIEPKHFIPAGTDVIYYYYLSDSPTTAPADSLLWKELSLSEYTYNNISFSDVSYPLSDFNMGRFLHLKVVMFSDGEGSLTPKISSIKIVYDKKNPMPPPLSVVAQAGEGSVKIVWSEVIDPDLDGYLVYFGEKSKKYFGSNKQGVFSPIDVGLENQLVINNLESGRMYYFSIVAYCKTVSAVGIPILEGGAFSKEVSVRPLFLNGER